MHHLVFIKPLNERMGKKISESERELFWHLCRRLEDCAPPKKTAIYAFTHAVNTARIVADTLDAVLVTEQSRRFEGRAPMEIKSEISKRFECEHQTVLANFSTLVLMAANHNMGDIVQRLVGQDPAVTGVMQLLQPGQAVVYEPGKKEYRVLL